MSSSSSRSNTSRSSSNRTSSRSNSRSARRVLTGSHADALRQYASRYRNRSGVNFSECRIWLNRRFHTSYSIYQVSAVLGNAGFSAAS